MAKKNKPVEPDFTLELNKNITVEFYERKNGYSAKLTFCDCFVVYGTVKTFKGKDKKTHGFLALPSWVNKDGDRVSQAFFFDSDIIEEINDYIDKNLI